MPRTAAAMITSIVALFAFGGIVVEATRWLRTLDADNRAWFLLGFCVVFGASAMAAALDHKRRPAAVCSAVLALLGVALVFIAGGIHATVVVPHGQPPVVVETNTAMNDLNTTKAHPPASGRVNSQTAHIGPQAATHQIETVPIQPTSDHDAVAKSYRPHATNSTPAPPSHSTTPTTKSSVVQEARGKHIAQANNRSTASVGATSTKSPPVSGSKPKSSVSEPEAESTVQKAEGEGIAQANRKSSASAPGGESLRTLDLSQGARWATPLSGFLSPRTRSVKVSFRANRKKHSRRQSKKSRRRHKATPTVTQEATGRGLAQANEHSTAVADSPTDSNNTNSPTNSNNNDPTGSNNTNSPTNSPTNSNNTNSPIDSNNTNSPTITTGATCPGLQYGASGSVTVSGNTAGGSATSGNVTNTHSTSGTGEHCEIEIGISGPATSSENTEGGNATSGNVEM